MAIAFGLLPSELEARMTLDDFYQLCMYMSFEPLPSNKIDISQAAVTSTIASLFNKVNFEDFLNPWIKNKKEQKIKELTPEEILEGRIHIIMGLSKKHQVDENGNNYSYEERYKLIKAELTKSKE